MKLFKGNWKNICVVSSALFVFSTSLAQDGSKTDKKERVKGFDFIENKGQWAHEGKYKVEIPEGTMFITDHGFVYSYTSGEDILAVAAAQKCSVEGSSLADRLFFKPPVQVRHHAYRVNFAGANNEIAYSPDDRRSYYYNYFLGRDTSRWKGNVGLFGKVVQRNIYEGIDVAVYSANSALKYDFIVLAGADPGKIVLSFEGVEPVLTDQGDLSISTSINEIVEQAPYAYQMINNRETAVECRYVLRNGQLSFEMPEGYDRNYDLIIDPTVVFATYNAAAGATTSQVGRSETTYDASGNLYSAVNAMNGEVNGNWPTTFGAFSTTYGGAGGPGNQNPYYYAPFQVWPSGDLFISKFNASGTNLIYGTYLGGEYDDIPLAIAVNQQNEVIVGGSTLSSNFPVTFSCVDPTLDSLDLFVTHLNSTGGWLIGSTLIGGSRNEAMGSLGWWPNVDYYVQITRETQDRLMGLVLDGQGNIWVGSNTASPDFPVSVNALQPAHGGALDGVFFKLSGNCTQLLYSSYLGGASTDAVLDIDLNNAGDVVVCGLTAGPGLPTSPNALHSSYQGAVDGFVMIVSNVTGAMMYGTYLGTPLSNEYAWHVEMDANNNVYVAGTSKWSGGGSVLPQYPVSPGTYFSPHGGVFVDKLTPDLSASIVSTTFGRMITGWADAVFIDDFFIDNCGRFYFYLNATGYIPLPTLFPTTANAFSAAEVWTTVISWCGVFDATLTNVIYGSFLDPLVSNNIGSSGAFSPDGGLYLSFKVGTPYPYIPIAVIATTPNVYAPGYASAGATWSSAKIDLSEFILDKDTIITNTIVDACFRDSVRIFPVDTTGTGYLWNNGAETPAVYADVSGKYHVTYRKAGDLCHVFIDSFDVVIYSLPGAEIQTTGSCPGVTEGSAQLLASPGNQLIYTFTWSEIGGLLLQTDQNTIGALLSRLRAGHYQVRIQTPPGCDTTLVFEIESFPVPAASFLADSIHCAGEEIDLINTSAGDFNSWQWDMGNGSTTTDFNPEFTYEHSGAYTITLVVNSVHCSDTFSKQITLGACCELSIPSAFSPNGDGVNDVFGPVMDGDVRVDFMHIYNRWGQRVFTGYNGDRWDGTFLGKPAEMGVYQYYMQADCVEETNGKMQRKGDVTVVR
jgi:gliding motility-associated-like protein